MKIYNLTIVFDENEDLVEYIEETVNEVKENVDFYGSVLREEYDRTTTIDILQQVKEKAKA